MIKLTASYSKKLPVNGVEFSSRQYSAEIQVEVTDQVAEKGLQDRLNILYGILEQTVDHKLGGADMSPPSPARQTPQDGAGAQKPSGGGQRTRRQRQRPQERQRRRDGGTATGHLRDQ